MKILIESMTRVTWGDLVIRVWREEPSGKRTDTLDLQTEVQNIANNAQAMEDAIEQILALPNVNAVEMLDRDSSGLVGYRDWP